MTPRPSPRSSKRTSTRKQTDTSTSEGAITEAPKPSLKIRLKTPVMSTTPVEDADTTNVASTSAVKPTMKLKLTLSKSSSNEETTKAADSVPGKKRGRPRKDPNAVKAAAVAASMITETEIQERKSRRVAAEERIRKSVSMDIISSNDVTGEEEAEVRRGRKPKITKSASAEYLDILGGKTTTLYTSGTTSSTGYSSSLASSSLSSSNSSLPPVQTSSFVNPNESEFVQKAKNILNVAFQQDHGSLQQPSFAPFASIADAVERLLPYHLALNAGQYDTDASFTITPNEDIQAALSALETRFQSIIQTQHSKRVPTELLLLEQRLCLEEEKFLLQKLKSEYNARYMALANQAISRSSTPKY